MYRLEWIVYKFKIVGYNTCHMRKEYVVKSIDASPDGSPYVVVSLASAKEMKENRGLQSPYENPKMMSFTNMNDMIKDLNKMFAGAGGMPGAVTAIKMDMHEYKQMNLGVGDRVFLELTKAEAPGV